jgi:hypothetical protein
MKYLGLAQEVDVEIKPHHIAKTIGWHNRYTPDIYKLEKYQHQLLFVYDEWMSDRRQHFVIEDYVTERVVAFTTQKFDFLIKDGCALPFPSDDGKIIKGEILALSDPGNAFKKLDKLRQNTVQYVRHRVELVDPYRPYFVINNHGFDEEGRELPPSVAGKKLWLGDEHLATQHAWMYFPRHDYWDYQRRRNPQRFHRVPSFTPRKDKTWLSEYYKYQNPVD